MSNIKLYIFTIENYSPLIVLSTKYILFDAVFKTMKKGLLSFGFNVKKHRQSYTSPEELAGAPVEVSVEKPTNVSIFTSFYLKRYSKFDFFFFKS